MPALTTLQSLTKDDRVVADATVDTMTATSASTTGFKRILSKSELRRVRGRATKCTCSASLRILLLDCECEWLSFLSVSIFRSEVKSKQNTQQLSEFQNSPRHQDDTNLGCIYIEQDNVLQPSASEYARVCVWIYFAF